ncbi:hypothetical protein ACHHYP_20128 [Achlya hypogyna]|uniref:Non-structural maintenance of chromosomes element 1 homolog n=1 Tax=Achlya hypogyna TaxID=1202772 RepID=A0A1V9ZR49_ACHHY|nr:hypothetical protein ACHHYP_20128 [Achlya hypogyna]
MSEAPKKLVQVLMAHGALAESELKPLVDQIYGRDFSLEEIGDLTSQVAATIQPYSLDIKSTVYDDGNVYYGLINTSNDEITKLSNTFKPWEIVLFRKAIEYIAETDDGELDHHDFLNMREANSTNDVKALLARLYAEKWLAPSMLTDTQATLGPRVFLELAVFLRDMGITQCGVCSSDALQSVRCTTPSCPTRVHESCLAKYERNGRKFKCAPCKKVLR